MRIWPSRETAPKPDPKAASIALADDTGNGEKPAVGSQLEQLAGQSLVSANIVRVLGEFNPRRVTLDDMFLMMRHPTVAFGLAILRGVLINMVWTVQSDDLVIQDFVEKSLRRRFRELARSISLAIFLGFAHVEMVWGVRKLVVDTEDIGEDGKKVPIEKVFPQAWVIDRFKSISPKTTSFIIDPELDEWIALQQIAPGSIAGVEPIEVPREKVVLWSFRKEDVFGALTGFGVAEQVYTPWYSSIATGLSTDRYMERKGEGGWIARYGRDITIGGILKTGADWISERLLFWRNGGTLALPNDLIKGSPDKFQWDVEPVEDSQRGDMFQARLDALDLAILRALFITEKAATSGDSPGSFAMAKVHADTMAQMIASIETEFIDEIVNPQVVDRIVLFNFGQQALDDTNTRVVETGISQGQRDAIKEFTLKLLEGEAIMEEGGSLKLKDVIDSTMLAKLIGLPMKSKEEVAAILKAKAARKAEMDKQLQPGGAGEEGEEEEDETEPDAVKDELIREGVTEAGDQE